MSYIETNLADAYTMASGGETKEFDLPRNFTTCLIKIIQQGDHDTDASTFAERQAGLGEIEIITKRGGEIMIDSEDLFKLCYQITKKPGYSYDGGGGDADDEIFTVWYLPFAPHPTNWFTPAGLFGLPGSIADKIRVKYDTDTAAGCDSRALTIQACGIRGVKPVSYMTYRKNTFTMVADALKYMKVGTGRIGGVFAYHTSSPIQGDTTDLVLTVKAFNIVVDRKPVLGPHKTIADLFPGPGAISPDDPVTWDQGLDSWTFWDLDPGRRGAGHPIVENMEISALGGIAEAARIYPIVYARV